MDSITRLTFFTRHANQALQLGTNNTAAIQRNRRTIDIRPRSAGQPNTCAGYILGRTDPAQRNTPRNHILILLQRRLHHLTLKRTARNRITRNPPLTQMARQHPAHMVQSGFRRRVRKRLEGGDAQAVYAADVDNAGGGGGRSCCFQQGRNGLCELEDALEVEVQHAVPSRRGVFIVGFAPVAAAVVDEDVEFCLPKTLALNPPPPNLPCTIMTKRMKTRIRTRSPLAQLRGNIRSRILLVQVCGYEICLALAQRIHLLARCLACFGVARGDEDGGTVAYEALADHAANAFGAAGYEDDFALFRCSVSIYYRIVRYVGGEGLRTLTSKRVVFSMFSI